MEANKAPEKVYLLFNRPYLVDYTKLNKRRCEEEVEYIRTDAFIDKACAWLTKYAKKYYFNKERYLGTEELVEDFKLSMEE